MANTPSLFPMFMKSTSGVTGIVYGGSIETSIQEAVSVEAVGELEVEYQDSPIPVEVANEIIIEVEVCGG